MKQSREQKHFFDTLFVSILFFVFLLCALSVVMIGSAVYKHSTEEMNDHFTTKTALAYVIEKVRQNDVNGAVELVKFDGVDALRLHREYDNTGYDLYIYAYDGKLMELFAKEGIAVTLANGHTIMELASLELEAPAEHCFHVTITDNRGNTDSIYIAERSAS